VGALIDIFTADELQAVLVQLRAVRSDHQWVEAKRAQTRLPADLWTSLSAFANSDLGGLVLLGVDEASGAFDVTGVGDPGQVAAELQVACAGLEPALRPAIHVITHPDGFVVVAHIQPVPRNERPCHRPDKGARESSYIRVGDSDQRMAVPEVEDLLANRVGIDHSLRPAPGGVTLDVPAVAQLEARARARTPRHAEVSDHHLLFMLGATSEDGHPTLAGMLAVGGMPQRYSASARVAYRRLPRQGAAEGARFAARHFEGTVGEILDDAIAALEVDLDPVQVMSKGQLHDELDVPREALREVLSNALVHRSLTVSQETASVAIEVSDDLVTVTSPGGLHVNADLRQLGLEAISAPRNLALVRICEHLTTPAGGRIIESQASGIAAADRACRRFGTAPALFSASPARFAVVLIRKTLDLPATQRRWALAGNDLDHVDARLVAFAERLEALQDEDALSQLAQVHLDAHLAARLLTTSPENGALLLGRLAERRVLTSRQLPDRTVWEATVPVTSDQPPAAGTVPTPTRGARRSEQIARLLTAVAASPSGELRARDMVDVLGLASSRSRNKVITDAVAKGLIEPTRDGIHDPKRAYRLTSEGRRQLG
jgi:ATP-dependent DNA helicase RecG